MVLICDGWCFAYSLWFCNVWYMKSCGLILFSSLEDWITMWLLFISIYFKGKNHYSVRKNWNMTGSGTHNCPALLSDCFASLYHHQNHQEKTELWLYCYTKQYFQSIQQMLFVLYYCDYKQLIFSEKFQYENYFMKISIIIVIIIANILKANKKKETKVSI